MKVLRSRTVALGWQLLNRLWGSSRPFGWEGICGGRKRFWRRVESSRIGMDGHVAGFAQSLDICHVMRIGRFEEPTLLNINTDTVGSMLVDGYHELAAPLKHASY